MRRRAYAVASWFLFLLALVIVGLWARSYSHGEGLGYDGTKGAAGVESVRAHVFVVRVAHSTVASRTPTGFRCFSNRIDSSDELPAAKWKALGFQYIGFDLAQGYGRSRAVGVPDWFIASVLAGGGVLFFARRGRRGPAHHCPKCGYDLRASPQRCPECGMPVADEVRAAIDAQCAATAIRSSRSETGPCR